MNPPQPIPVVDPLYADLRRRDPVRPALIVDVRERDEFADVRLEGTLLIPMSELAGRLEEIPRDRPVLVMCAMGGRSATAVGHLLSSGWTDVANVAGGITQWERMGLPVRRGPVQPGEGTGTGA
jgi:rhodanese-related sulfurtransferase